MVRSYSEADLAAVLGKAPECVLTQPSNADLSDPTETVKEDEEESLIEAPLTSPHQEDHSEKSLPSQKWSQTEDVTGGGVSGLFVLEC